MWEDGHAHVACSGQMGGGGVMSKSSPGSQIMEGCCRDGQNGPLICADSEVWDFGGLIPVKSPDAETGREQREGDALNATCIQILHARSSH